MKNGKNGSSDKVTFKLRLKGCMDLYTLGTGEECGWKKRSMSQDYKSGAVGMLEESEEVREISSLVSRRMA